MRHFLNFLRKKTRSGDQAYPKPSPPLPASAEPTPKYYADLSSHAEPEKPRVRIGETAPAGDRRKQERTLSGEEVYVVTDTNPQILGQMVEISTGGMAFTFVDLNHVSQGLANRLSLRLDLFSRGRGHFIRDLPCRLVSCTEESGSRLQCQARIRRIGLLFENLTIPQQVQVNSLIRRQRTA